MNTMKEGLPPLPDYMRHLHISDKGYPVPWFVAWLDENGRATQRGKGKPDFRVIAPNAIVMAHSLGLCWLCGDKLGSFRTFVIGPMCALNKTSAEPPSHRDCADYAARACPFLTNPRERRNEKDKPAGHLPPAGVMIPRNPGVALVWTTRRYRTFPDDAGGMLFNIGDPTECRWYREGRPATREEVLESIDSGIPILEAECHKERNVADALTELRRRYDAALKLLPAA